MKLYFAPGVCSMASHIVLNELGLQHEIQKVDIRAQPHVLAGTTTEYATVNPKASVPALKLDSGEVMTEGAVILQYLADQKPEAGLVPKAGTMERYRLMEWLNFISADVHKAVTPFFNPTMPAEAKAIFKTNLDRRLGHLDHHLAKNHFIMGDKFGVADAYLFTVLSWMPIVKLDVSAYKHVTAHSERVASRPAVQKTMAAEGLI